MEKCGKKRRPKKRFGKRWFNQRTAIKISTPQQRRKKNNPKTKNNKVGGEEAEKIKERGGAAYKTRRNKAKK